MAAKKPAPAVQTVEAESVTLESHYAFADDEGNVHAWHEGQVVTDPDHIAILVKRKAPLKDVDHE